MLLLAAVSDEVDGRNTINIASTMLNVSSPPPCEAKKENNKNALKRSPRNIFAMVVLQQFYLLGETCKIAVLERSALPCMHFIQQARLSVTFHRNNNTPAIQTIKFIERKS